MYADAKLDSSENYSTLKIYLNRISGPSRLLELFLSKINTTRSISQTLFGKKLGPSQTLYAKFYAK